MFSQIINLLKLRIGVVMMLTALVAMAVTPGQPASALEMAVLAFAILAAPAVPVPSTSTSKWNSTGA